MPPASTRKPMVTAISATDKVASSSRAKLERKAMRKVPMVPAREASSVRFSPASWARARPKTCRVGNPATRSAKWLANRAWVCQRLFIAASVRQPMRAMNTGMSGTVMMTMTRLRTSCRPMAMASTTGTIEASTNWGRYLE